MANGSTVELRYQPTYCAFLRKRVWAILTKQPDGSWRIVNCLDKDEDCFRLDCAFTTDHGEWPFRPAPAEPADEANARRDG